MTDRNISKDIATNGLKQRGIVFISLSMALLWAGATLADTVVGRIDAIAHDSKKVMIDGAWYRLSDKARHKLMASRFGGERVGVGSFIRFDEGRDDVIRNIEPAEGEVDVPNVQLMPLPNGKGRAAR